MEEDIVDLTDYLDEEDTVMCPICDNMIMNYEPAFPIIAHSAKMLAHAGCLVLARQELGI